MLPEIVGEANVSCSHTSVRISSVKKWAGLNMFESSSDCTVRYTLLSHVTLNIHARDHQKKRHLHRAWSSLAKYKAFYTTHSSPMFQWKIQSSNY